jgi:hypothetical protein
MPTIKGTGKPGELIFIYDNGRGCGGTTVDANGNGSVRIQANSPLTNGVHDIKAYAMNSAHVWSAASNDYGLYVASRGLPNPLRQFHRLTNIRSRRHGQEELLGVIRNGEPVDKRLQSFARDAFAARQFF